MIERKMAHCEYQFFSGKRPYPLAGAGYAAENLAFMLGRLFGE